MKRESKSCGNCAFLEPAPCNDCRQGHTKWKAGTSLMLSEVRRLRGWMRRWNDGEQAETDTGNTTLVPNAELVSALSGKPAPRRRMTR